MWNELVCTTLEKNANAMRLVLCVRGRGSCGDDPRCAGVGRVVPGLCLAWIVPHDTSLRSMLRWA